MMSAFFVALMTFVGVTLWNCKICLSNDSEDDSRDDAKLAASPPQGKDTYQKLLTGEDPGDVLEGLGISRKKVKRLI
jgi:hypothetical protein